MNNDRHPVIFRVVSGKGGVGKSFIASTLAYALASKGKKTLFIDLDTGLRNVDLVLGIRDKVVYNMFDVAEKGVPLEAAVVKGIGKEGDPVPDFLFCDNNKTKNAVSMEAVGRMLSNAAQEYDALVLDSPAGVEYGFKMAATIGTESNIRCCTIIVSTPEMPVLNTAHSIANRLVQMDDEKETSASEEPVYLVLNRCIPELTSSRVNGGITPEEAARQIMVPLLGAVPMDLDIVSCANQGRPIWVYRPKSVPRAVVSEMANFLVKEFFGEEVKEATPEERAEMVEKQLEAAMPAQETSQTTQEEKNADEVKEGQAPEEPSREIDENTLPETEDEQEKESYPGEEEYKAAAEENMFGDPPAAMSVSTPKAPSEENHGFIARVFRRIFGK